MTKTINSLIRSSDMQDVHRAWVSLLSPTELYMPLCHSDAQVDGAIGVWQFLGRLAASTSGRRLPLAQAAVTVVMS